MEKLAKSRGDSELYWSIRVLVGRLALGQGEWSVVLDVVQTVGEVTGVAVSAAGDAKGKAVRLEAPPHLKDQGLLGRQLKIQFLILFCLYQAQMGNVKLAKEKLKLAHSLLDEKDAEPGEMEGWVLVSPFWSSCAVLTVHRLASILPGMDLVHPPERLSLAGCT